MTEWNNDTVRQEERRSIRAFVESCSLAFTGQVLDYGCGVQPYRDVVEAAGGEYRPFDRATFPANVGSHEGADDPLRLGDYWDSILCNQVIQYVPFPLEMMAGFAGALRKGGHLVLTGPTNWAEVEPEDLHRHTLRGACKLVRAVGLEIVRAERRAVIALGGFELSLGYGILARR